MDDTSGLNRYRLLVVVSIVTLIVILILVSRSPATFLNWFVSILAAFSLLLLFVFVFALVFVVIGAVLHQYIKKRHQETDDESPDQQSLQPRIRRVQYFPRRERHHQPTDEREDSDY